MPDLAILALIGLPSVLGWGLLAPVGRSLLVVERAAMAPVLGMSVYATVNFWAAMGLGLRTTTIWASAFAAGAVGAGLILRESRARRSAAADGTPVPPAPAGRWRAFLAREGVPLLLGLLVLPYYAVLYAKIMFERGPYWVTGTLHSYGDIVLHWGIAASFAYGDNFPPEHVLFPGVRFSYPVLSDFNTGLMLRLGVPVPDAWFAQNLVLVTAFTLLVYAFGARVGGRPAVGLWTVAFFFLTGGLGIWHFFKDLQATAAPVWAFLWNLPRDYGEIRSLNYLWGSPLLIFLTISRSFFFGFPLGAMALVLLAVGIEGPRRPAFLLAGVVAGLTPLFHTHTFLVVGLVAVGLAILRPNREWRWFFAMGAVVGLPAVLWLAPAGMPLLGPVAEGLARILGWPPQAQEGGRVLRFHFGWEKGTEDFFLFWFRNLGLFPVLAAGAFLGRRVPETTKRFCLPFVVCFILPNTFPLTPWVWDSNKLLAYWILGMGPVIGCLLTDVWRCREAFHKAATGAVVASILLAGILDTFRVVTPGAGEYGQFDQDAVRVAAEIRARTEPRARILTGPYHNSPVFLAGRKPLLAITAYVDSHGIPIGNREADMKRMLRGEAEALALMRLYRVSYALIGNLEVRDFQANRAFFEAHFPRIATVGPYALYDLRGGGGALRSDRGENPRGWVAWRPDAR